jgi:nicotinamidase-related amidase
MDPRPDYSSIALVTVDLQRDFLDDGVARVPGTSAVVHRLRPLVGAFRIAGQPVVHVVSRGGQLAAGLTPAGAPALDFELLSPGRLQALGAGEVAIRRLEWSAFRGTMLHQHLRGLGVTTLAFAGCDFPGSPRASLLEASRGDYALVLVEDGVSWLREHDRPALELLGVTLLAAAELQGHLVPGSDHEPVPLRGHRASEGGAGRLQAQPDPRRVVAGG